MGAPPKPYEFPFLRASTLDTQPGGSGFRQPPTGVMSVKWRSLRQRHVKKVSALGSHASVCLVGSTI
jgi:hypothetical protein